MMFISCVKPRAGEGLTTAPGIRGYLSSCHDDNAFRLTARSMSRPCVIRQYQTGLNVGAGCR